MDRRSFITGLAAGTAALAHTGLAQASTSEAFSKKTRPVDTMNRIGGWTNGSVEVIDIKGVRIGEGRPKLIAPTTSKTEADLIATVRKFADMPALNVIEVRIDYLGKIDPKDYARITRDAYAAAGDKVVLVTLRNGTDGIIFAIDEIHSEYSAKSWNDVPESLLSEVSQQRKQRVKIVATAQFFTRVAKPLREQAATVVSCSTWAGRLTRNREYDALQYAMVIENPVAVKRKVKPLHKASFVQSDALRACYDTFEKIRRMEKIQFSPRKDRGEN